jgi:hypothetical protein
MRLLTMLLFLAATSCGQTALNDVDGGGDDADTGLGGSGGNPDNHLSGNCIDEAFDAGASSCSDSLPLPCKPCINCAPLQPGDSGGCPAPDGPLLHWGGGGVDMSLRYPVGCQVFIPTLGPMSPSGPVSCYCSTQMGSPDWACPI